MSDRQADTQAIYRHFGTVEAPGNSDLYAGLALGVADDAEALALIGRLPAAKQQVNLIFGAARYLGAPFTTYEDFREWLVGHWASVEAMASSRATQTNEAGRCAVLLPVLSRLPGPLTLLEVGASAGLCLYPDRYSHRYRASGGTTALDPAGGVSPVQLDCVIEAGPAPSLLPEVAWRTGVDLNPLDPADPDTLRWLDALIWPEHEDRRRRLREALDVAAAHPARVVRGDLLTKLPELIERAPAGTRLVVFHTAVLSYLSAPDVQRFAALVRADPRVTWVSNEHAGVLPEVDARLPMPAPGNRMILAVNGEPVALTHPHGRSYRPL